MLPGDPLSRVLYIDLARLSSKVVERPDIFKKGLGGTGASIQLLSEEIPQGADPLGCLLYTSPSPRDRS